MRCWLTLVTLSFQLCLETVLRSSHLHSSKMQRTPWKATFFEGLNYNYCLNFLTTLKMLCIGSSLVTVSLPSTEVKSRLFQHLSFSIALEQLCSVQAGTVLKLHLGQRSKLQKLGCIILLVGCNIFVLTYFPISCNL